MNHITLKDRKYFYRVEKRTNSDGNSGIRIFVYNRNKVGLISFLDKGYIGSVFCRMDYEAKHYQENIKSMVIKEIEGLVSRLQNREEFETLIQPANLPHY